MSLSSKGPQLEVSECEKQAFSLLELAKGQQLTYALTNAERRDVEALYKALRTGNKVKVYELSQAFYAYLVKPGAVTAAYFKVEALKLTENTNFRIIMDWLKDKYGRLSPPSTLRLSLEEAVVFLLLAVTHRPEESISYNRIRVINGQEKICPTTYPLKGPMIRDFLVPFGDLGMVVKQAVAFHKHTVLGNPAAILAQAHAAKRAVWLAQRAAWEAEEQQRLAQLAEQAQVQAARAQLEAVSSSTNELYALCRNPGEIAAVELALSESALQRLAGSAAAPPSIFLKRLQAVYAQRLDPAQALQLAERMAQAFQALLQALQRLEGKDWMQLWRSAQTFRGKQPAQPVISTASTGEDLIAAEAQLHAVRLDKRAGAEERARSLPIAERDDLVVQPLPELAWVLRALADPAHLRALLPVALTGALREALPQELQALLELTFSTYSEASMSVLKAQFLQAARGSHQDLAQRVLADVERACNQLARLSARYRKLDFLQVLELMSRQAQEAEERVKLASPQFRTSVAGHYYFNGGRARP